MRIGVVGVSAALILVAATGCSLTASYEPSQRGVDTTSKPPSPVQTHEAMRSVVVDECELVTAAEVSRIVGEEYGILDRRLVPAMDSSEATCGFGPANWAPGRFDIGVDILVGPPLDDPYADLPGTTGSSFW